MKRWMQLLKKLVGRERRPNGDERYLGRSVDAHEFERRVQALERQRR